MQRLTSHNTTDLIFTIPELVPYINWIYFYHAWGIREEQGSDLLREADELLTRWAAEERQAIFRFRLFEANSQGEDILLYGHGTPATANASAPLYILPLLRQQREPFLCLADFIPPVGHESTRMGIFASSIPCQVEGLMEQTVADRLAEAAAEYGHLMVRTSLWGYAPDESLTPKELFAEKYTGKRPAIGYPSLPDQSLNFLLHDMLELSSMGVTLTENGAMRPHASTSGLMLAHPRCKHFSIGGIGEDQLQDYARRRGMDAEPLRKFIDVV